MSLPFSLVKVIGISAPKNIAVPKRKLWDYTAKDVEIDFDRRPVTCHFVIMRVYELSNKIRRLSNKLPLLCH